MLGIDMQHGAVGPARGALLRINSGYRGFLRAEDVGLKLPGTGCNHALVGEIINLHKRIVPELANEFALRAQQIEGRFVLRLIQLLRVFDAQGRIFLLQVKRGIGDINRTIKRLDATLVAFTVR